MKAIPQRVNVSLWWLVNRNIFLFSFLVGTWLAIAYPPFPLAFLIFTGFIPLFALVEYRYYPRQISFRRLWLTFYLTFLFWNFFTCYWLMLTALWVGDLQEAILAFAAGLVANIANALLQTLPLLLYTFVRQSTTSLFASFTFIFFWLGFEYLHFNWELSWSWLTLGHAFTFYPIYIQFVEFTGVLGVSLLVLLINVLLWQGIVRQRGQQLYWIVAWVLLLVPLVLSPILTNPRRQVFQKVGTIKVRIVQPNIDPYAKFNQLSDEAQVYSFIEQMKSKSLEGVDLVILPETALPFYLEEGYAMQHSLVYPLLELCARQKCSILTGAVALRFYNHCDSIPASAKVYLDASGKKYCYETYNAATTIFAGSPGIIYKKAKLVPFTERTPFLEEIFLLKGWEIDLGGGFGSFGYPDSIFSLALHNGVQVAPVICYESQFGDYVRHLFLKGAQLGCIITNDGWFGNSSGYIQHAYLATLRAIENRREFARCANTGMSLFVDSKGYVYQKLGWWKKGVIDRELNLYQTKTFYMTHGDYIGKYSVIIAIVLLLSVFVRSKLRLHYK
ncbi:MAG: apolipoprotein N-acyltransferase [Bacteroidia bacterium]|nr:apolipoprotein N-acyltransferase [Bacteroidia bacterium]MDW8158159.1 apolipoprotein N-acyltransferase [Bacteroidia bacterium]